MIKITRIDRGTWQMKAFDEHEVDFIIDFLKLMMKIESLRAVDSTRSAGAGPLSLAETELPSPAPEVQRPDSIVLLIRSPQCRVPLL